ncbi:Nucleosome assembly protein 1-like 1 [Goodea atripinnis]|uniref:Nucleosome assembly protein 1-like 1 n=1 Tax=Goodea atripinnis TaxID=208336 RepID=A0ABV0MEV3_9TELE
MLYSFLLKPGKTSLPHQSTLTFCPRLSTARQLTVQMMQNPQILAALQERLDGLNGSPSGYMERTVLSSPVCSFSHSLPKVVKRRVNALKNLQVKCAHIEAKFYEEVHELERKYAALYQPLFDKFVPVEMQRASEAVLETMPQGVTAPCPSYDGESAI